MRCSALQCDLVTMNNKVRCSALQCVAVRCSALQCVAVRCSALQRVRYYIEHRVFGDHELYIAHLVVIQSGKRATNHRALMQKMTYKDKPSYESSPPCSNHALIDPCNR